MRLIVCDGFAMGYAIIREGETVHAGFETRWPIEVPDDLAEAFFASEAEYAKTKAAILDLAEAEHGELW